MLSGVGNSLVIFERAFSDDPCGSSHHELTGRDDGSFRDDRACGDNTPRTDHRTVKDDRSYPDEDIVLDRRTVNNRAMTERYAMTDRAREPWIRVDHTQVLNVRRFTDTDRRRIATYDGAEPDTGTRT